MSKTNIRSLVIAAVMTSLTAVGAFIRIPLSLYPAPFTLQTMFVYASGLLLNKREAFLCQLAYVTIGLIGIPIFSGGGGIAYVLNPTFGYLLAFCACSYFLGTFARPLIMSDRKIKYWLVSFCSVIILQAIGALYFTLISVFYIKNSFGFSDTAKLFLLFIPLDCIKIFIATLLAKKLIPIIGAGAN